jgi:NAD(P)-dependent dehydrogenase (short-subunit alcohol dehydrogenase family)
MAGRALWALCAAAACIGRSANASGPPVRGTAIVTGGGRGIGAACSRRLAAMGYGVVVTYISDEAAASAVCGAIRSSGGMAHAIRADVSSEADVMVLFAFADGCFGESPLRALVNNAGMLGPSGVNLCEVGDAATLARIMAVNVGGPMLCCREAQRRMSTKLGGRGGSVVQISSGSAYIGNPVLYSASKGALNSLTIGLVRPFGEAGIRLNTVSPGMTDTDLVGHLKDTFDWSQVPLGRIGTPEEVANAVGWLCSDEASYIAGANIRVSGGRPPGTTLG